MSPAPGTLAERSDAERYKRLEAEANAELSIRLIKGIYAYVAMMALLALTTESFREHPRLMWGSTTLMSMGLMFRVALIARTKRLNAVDPARWRLLTGISVAVIGGACGYFHAAFVILYGFESWPFALSMIWVAGLATGGSITFVPYMSLVWLHLLLMEGPVLAASLWAGGVRGNAFAITICLFIVFLVTQSRHLHAAYWKGLLDRALEADRRRELEALSQAKSQFLANMSHEIRTPMHGILGMAQLLQKTSSSADQRDYYLDTLHKSAKGLLHVLNDVLDFSKVDAGKLSLETIPFDVRAIVEETRQILIAQAESKALHLEYAVSPEVPSAVRGDPVRLRQVLLNLAANAIKFTSSGRVGVRVRRGELTADHVELHFQVEDTGIGIPKEQQTRIFEAFSQADASVTRRFGGTGLGLAICSQLVQLMGGQIELESEPGIGSRFFFSCRFGLSAEEPVVAGAPSHVPAAPLRILLAEDNLVNQTVAIRLLERDGHSVRLATTGLQAIDAVAAEQFDLVLMDNQMPECSGIEAARAIRASGFEGPIVGLSADAMNGDRERFLAAGMDGYLAKPFCAEELYAAVHGFTSRYRSPA